MTAARELARRGPHRGTTDLAIAGAAALAGLAIGLVAAWTSVGIVVGLAAVVALGALLVRPELAVVIVVGLVWADLPVVAVRDHGLPYVVGAALPLLLLVVVARDALAGRAPILERGVCWIVALVLASTLSTMLSPHQGRATATLAAMLAQGVLLYLLVVNAVRDDRAVRAARWAVIAAGSWLALIAVVQGVAHKPDQPFWGFAQLDLAYANGKGDVPRAFGPVGDPNYFQQLLLPVVAFAFVALCTRKRGPLRAASGAALALTLAAIGFTSSRGAVFALGIMVVVAVAIRVIRASHAAVAVALCAALLLTIPGYRERLLSVVHIGSVTARAGDGAAADDSARSRATEGMAAYLVFKDHPLVGAGPGVFPLLYQDYAPRVGYQVIEEGVGSEAGEAPTREAHNLYLGVAADTGMAGLLAFLGLLGAILFPLCSGARRLRDARPELAASAAALALGLVGYLAAGLFLSLAYERYFWLLLGLAAATARLTRLAMRDLGA